MVGFSGVDVEARYTGAGREGILAVEEGLMVRHDWYCIRNWMVMA